MPVSATVTAAQSPSRRTVRSTRPPGRLYLTALSARLQTSSSSICRLPRTVTRSPETAIATCFCSAGKRSASAAPSQRARSSTGSSSTAPDCSMRERRMMSSVSAISLRASL